MSEIIAEMFCGPLQFLVFKVQHLAGFTWRSVEPLGGEHVQIHGYAARGCGTRGRDA
jgi:hypothetical protein